MPIPGLRQPWWEGALLYQIYPRSFADSNGDGIGDLPGLRARLDYLHWLGVDAVWLNPTFPSPNKDWGYDVADYCGVHPDLGTLTDLDELIVAAGERDIKVVLDLVPAHTSDRHVWFVESRSARESARRDWYIWRDEADEQQSVFGGDAWTHDAATNQYYHHLFLPEQPDLNWSYTRSSRIRRTGRTGRRSTTSCAAGARSRATTSRSGFSSVRPGVGPARTS